MNWTGAMFAQWLSYPDNLHSRQPLSAKLQEAVEETSAEAGTVALRFQVGEEFCNFSGRVHGGIISLMLDEAIGIAATLRVGDRFRSTIESKTSFFKSTRAGSLLARGKMLHETKGLGFLEAQLYDEEGAVCAQMLATVSFRSAE
jgi:uncharacterized protein (TIGR00369 family)